MLPSLPPSVTHYNPLRSSRPGVGARDRPASAVTPYNPLRPRHRGTGPGMVERGWPTAAALVEHARCRNAVPVAERDMAATQAGY